MALSAGSPAQLAVSVMLPLLGTLVIALRFMLRRRSRVTLGTDDWLCLPALIFTWGCSAVVFWGVARGVVGHTSPDLERINKTDDMHAQEARIIHKAIVIFNFLSYFSLGFAKLSVLFYYRRIFVGPIFNIVSWVFIAIVSLWTCVFSLVWIFSCGKHFQKLWGAFVGTEVGCLDTFSQLIAGSAVDFIMDVFIFSIPIVMVWQLQMPTERKLIVIAIFLTGAISVVAGILRFVVTEAHANSEIHNTYDSILGLPSTDTVGMVSFVMLFTMIEVGVAIIAICLPTLRVGTLFYKTRWDWFTRLGSKLSPHRSSSKQGHSSYQAMSRSRTHVECNESGHSKQSERALNGIGYEIDIRVESQDGSASYTEAKRRYEDLFPPASGKVEARPKEAV